jgi:hypothetical protein
METPLVKEQIRPLESVGPDPFIDGPSPAPAHGWATASLALPPRFVTDDEPRRI